VFKVFSIVAASLAGALIVKKPIHMDRWRPAGKSVDNENKAAGGQRSFIN